MSPGQGPALPPPLCLSRSLSILSVFWLNHPKLFSPLIRPVSNEHPSHLSASTATLCARFLCLRFWLFAVSPFPASPLTLFLVSFPLCFLSSHFSSSLQVSLMRWHDRKGTGFIVKSRTYHTIQMHNHSHIKALTLDPRYLWHQLND